MFHVDVVDGGAEVEERESVEVADSLLVHICLPVAAAAAAMVRTHRVSMTRSIRVDSFAAYH